MQRSDIRVIELRKELGFSLETIQTFFVENSSGRTLIATSRPSFESLARYTSPYTLAKASRVRRKRMFKGKAFGSDCVQGIISRLGRETFGCLVGNDSAVQR